MSELVTLLSATGQLLLAKRFTAETKEAFATVKNFSLRTESVDDLRSLSDLLRRIESDSQTCVVRGGYIGDDLAVPLMRNDERWKPGCILRQMTVLKDRALHAVMIDVDGYEAADPDVTVAIRQYVEAELPVEFHDVSYHWQLSNSAGMKPGLNVHLWFWLLTPYTSSQLRAWAVRNRLLVDTALFNPIQIHYTAGAVFEGGAVDPIAVRSGFEQGLFGDEVALVIDDADLGAVTGAVSRIERMASVGSSDPIVALLNDKGLLLQPRSDGGYNTLCPRRSEHGSGDGSPSSTIYYPAHTGGFARGSFKCLHAGCAGVAQGLFTEALGLSVLDGFKEVTPGASTGALPAVPEAKHLCSDQANVGRLISHFGNRLICVGGRWYVWNGIHWKADESAPSRIVMNLSRIVSDEADAWTRREDVAPKDRDALAEALMKWSKRCEMAGTIAACLSLARSSLDIAVGRLDSDPLLVNFLNGTFDVRTGGLRPHNPDDLITRCFSTIYNPNATCDLFRTVIQRVTNEANGPAPVVAFLQRWFGYCATGSVREQKFVVHYGGGANGKSLILDLMAELFGAYAGTAAPELLMSRGSDRHPTEIADLCGRRMVTASESGEGGVLREDFIKQATGGDRLKARLMKEDFFEFVPTHKLQLITNYRPVIKGQDHGIWRRVLMVPYNVRFGSPEEVAVGFAQYVKDIDLAQKIRTEMPGIAKWLMDGAVEWYRDGLNPPDYVIAASTQYKEDNDRVLQFVRENCVIDRVGVVMLTDEFNNGLYQIYVDWSKEVGAHALGKNRFLQEITRIVPGVQKHEVKRTTMSGRRRDFLQLQGLRVMGPGD